jgi:hypothetical protein
VGLEPGFHAAPPEQREPEAEEALAVVPESDAVAVPESDAAAWTLAVEALASAFVFRQRQYKNSATIATRRRV